MKQGFRELLRTPIDLSARAWVMIPGDLALLFVVYYGAFELRASVRLPGTGDYMPLARLFQLEHRWWLLLSSQIVFLFLLDLYHEIAAKDKRGILTRAVTASALQALLITSVNFFMDTPFPRTIVLMFALLNGGAMALWRMALRATAIRTRRDILVVGAEAEGLVDDLGRNSELPVHRLEEFSADQIGRLLDRRRIGTVILVPDQWTRERIVEVFSLLKRPDLRVFVVPREYEILMGKVRRTRLHGVPLIRLGAGLYDPLELFLRRVLDLTVAFGALVLASPALLLIAASIRLTSGKGVLYRQKRVGRGGRIFELYKFRTMYDDAERETGPVLASANDLRVTPLGKVLRRLRADELPQFVNIVKGDMSLVGPRPERVEFVQQLVKSIPHYNERHLVRPGITGLAQVFGYYDTVPENKLRYDLAYIFNYSFLLDLQIMLETVRVMLTRKGI